MAVRVPTDSLDALENIHVRMLRPSLADYPRFPLPDGFSLRTFAGETADRNAWTDVQRRSDFLKNITDDLFDDQFGYDLPAMRGRCLFLVDPDGSDVGTSTAWYDDAFHGHCLGRVHWVAIVPEFQGRGLAKPLMSATLDRLAKHHGRAYLSTNTPRLPAINLYLNLGFQPFLDEPHHERGWQQVRKRLAHPLLDQPLTPADL